MSAPEDFAAWLNEQHPDVYGELYVLYQRVPRRLSGFGDDTSDIGVTTTFDDSSGVSDSSLQDIAVDQPIVSAPNVVTQPDSGTSGGILSDVGNVASWLVSPQGLTSIANVATGVLKVQQTAQVAQMQQQIITQNAQRAAAGQPVVPITYAQNAQGQTVPVYDTRTMQLMPPELETAIQQGRAHPVTLPDGTQGYAVDPATVTSLLNSSGIPWYVFALGALALIALVR